MDAVSWVSFEDELEKIGDVRKTAGLGTLLGIGAASHLGVNALIKGLTALGKKAPSIKNPTLRRMAEAYPKWKGKKFEAGINRGLQAEGISAKRRFGQTWLAPEAYIPEEAGYAVGKLLRGHPEKARMSLIKRLSETLEKTPELHKTPVFSSARRGLKGISEKGLAPIREKPASTMLSRFKARFRRAPSHLGGAAMVAAEPASAIHGAINKLRMYTARSKLGKEYFKRESLVGAAKGQKVLAATPKRDFLKDIVISPSAGDPGRIARDLANLAKTNPKGAVPLMRALDDLAKVNPAYANAKMDVMRQILGAAKGRLGPRSIREYMKLFTG